MARRVIQFEKVGHNLDVCRGCNETITSYVSNNPSRYCEVYRDLCATAYKKCPKCEFKIKA